MDSFPLALAVVQPPVMTFPTLLAWRASVVWQFRRRHPRLLTQTRLAAPLACLLAATGLWLSSLRPITPRTMSDMGLISVLPATFFIAFALLTAGFCMLLREHRPNKCVLLMHLAMAVLMLYGTPIFGEQVLGFGITWRHVGIVDYITRHGAVNPSIDAYFSWPGFFVLGAFLTQLLGWQNALGLAAWAPVVFNALYLGPIAMIARSVSGSPKTAWLAAWLFCLTNWVGQDYFSPQGFNWFIYLTVLAILVTWFKAKEAPGLWGSIRALQLMARSRLERLVQRLLFTDTGPSLPRSTEIALLVAVVGLLALAVAGHQLTPVAALATITLLVVCNGIRARWLPVALALMIALWWAGVAEPFFAGHMSMVFGGIGDVSQNVDENVVSHLQGSPGHRFVVSVRLAMTVVVWGLACVGIVRRLRANRCDLTLALAAVAPFPLMALQAYGGELLLRVYLFALAPVAFFAAALFFPGVLSSAGKLTTVAIGATSMVLLFGFLIARYGNERADTFTAKEEAAVSYLYRVAPPGSVLATANWDVPWRSQDYELYDYRDFLGSNEADNAGILRIDNVPAVSAFVQRNEPKQTFILLTDSEQAELSLLSDFPPQTLARFRNALESSHKFRTIFDNGDAQIFVQAGAPVLQPLPTDTANSKAPAYCRDISLTVGTTNPSASCIEPAS